MRSVLEASIAVSSAYVAIVVFAILGMSDVYILNKSGARSLP